MFFICPSGDDMSGIIPGPGARGCSPGMGCLIPSITAIRGPGMRFCPSMGKRGPGNLAPFPSCGNGNLCWPSGPNMTGCLTSVNVNNILHLWFQTIVVVKHLTITVRLSCKGTTT